MTTASLGRGWSDDEIERWLQTAKVPHTRPPRHRRGRGRCARRGRHRRVVPRPQRVRAAGARQPQPAGRPAEGAEPGAVERRQRPRAVPAGGADGARRAGGARSSPAARSPVRTCSSSTTSRRRGANASRPSCTSTGRRGSRPSTRTTQPLVHRCSTLRGAHRHSGRREHVAQHSRSADGRRPARRAGVLRLGTDGRAGDRSLPRPPAIDARMTVRASGGFDVVIPTVGRPSLDRAAVLAGVGVLSWTSDRGRRPPRANRSVAPVAAPTTARTAVAVERWARTGGGAQRRLARLERRLDRVPRRRRDRRAGLVRAVGRRSRLRSGGRRSPGAHQRAAVRRPATDRLGSATSPGCARPGRRPLTWRTAVACCAPWTASTNASPAPIGRTPTSPCAPSAAGVEAARWAHAG